MNKLYQTGNFIISIIMLLLSIASIIGLYWLSVFAFTAKKNSDGKSYTVSDFDRTKLNLSRFTVILIWIQISVSIISVLWWTSHRF